jgi:uncharacterized protein (TIGR01244 family)
MAPSNPMRLRLIISLALLALTGCHSIGGKIDGVSNFAVVEDGPAGVCRGAQPSELGIGSLKSRGVRTVIDLRDDAVAAEATWTQQAELKYVRIPMNAGRVEPQKVQAFLAAVQSSPRPVYVHCMLGRDRTGLSIAMYRIIRQGWSREDAIRELYAHGYNWALYPGIARFLRSFNPADYLPGTSS